MLNKNINIAPIRLGLLLVMGFFLFAITITCSAREGGGITVQVASIERQGESFFLNAKIDYHLSAEAIEALSSGITLIFNVKFSTIEQRRFLWNKHSYKIILPYHIKYHTLAETYQVTDLTTQHQQNFSSLSSAMEALGSLKQIPLQKLTPAKIEQRIGRLSAYLNIEGLPLPMRPLAYLTPAWHLSSNTFKWPLK